MEDLDALVRRVDEDRWMASRFASADARQRLMAIYAVNYEIARTAEVVKEPALGDIRLAWWRDAIVDALGGKSSDQHEALAALRAAHRATALSPRHFTTLIEARRHDLDVAPFEDWAAFDAYVDATAGSVMRLAAEACGVIDGEHAPFISRAAWLWGSVGLLRAEARWRGRGRALWPSGSSSDALLARVDAALKELRAMRAPAPALFPAYGYLANVAAYMRGLRRDAPPRAPLARRLRIVLAAATGRV